MKGQKELEDWAATYGNDKEDIRASMYDADLMIEFAKYYHKEQLNLSGVSTRTFAENQEVTYMGNKYFFKEYNPKNGKTLIANAKSVRYHDYNDWWVDSAYVC